jgi:nucleotidyltransferase substrate binding protein (TIGR01987 family)
VTNRQKFNAAVKTLREFVDEPIVTKRDVAGVLQGFEFSFELALKSLQDEIQALGYTQRGPRLVLQAAYDANLITPEDAEIWADILEDRNLVAHMYRPEWAIELANRIKDQHLPALEALVQRLDAQKGPA